MRVTTWHTPAVSATKTAKPARVWLTSATKMKISAEKSVEIIPDKYKINIVEELDRVLVQGEFEENYMVQIILTAENGDKLRRAVETANKEFQAMCVGIFQKENSKQIDTFINKTNLSGKYDVEIIVPKDEDNFVAYPTGVSIEA